MRAKEFIVENNKNDFVWHGSRKKIAVLEPRQANDVGGAKGSNKNAIYATTDPTIAIKMAMPAADADHGMWVDDPTKQVVIFKGDVRHGENVYLHKLPRYDANGNDMWEPGGNSKEFYSKPEIKSIKPLEVEEEPVDNYLKLVRKATKDDWQRRKNEINKNKKQGVAEGNLDSLIKSDQEERNAYKKFVADRAGGDWKLGAELYAKLKNRPADDIFGDDARLQEFMRIKFDFGNFTEQDWWNFWLLSQHADAYPGFQQQALRAIEKHLGQDNDHYRYLADRISCAKTGQQKYGTQNICVQQGVAEGKSL